jgi:hypothetical protein
MPFDISFGGFVNFFLGMVTGVVAFLGMFTFLSFRGKRVNLDNIKRPEIEMDEAELRQLIEGRQLKLKRMIKYDQDGAIRSTMNVAYELIEEISRYFFPNSHYPMLELSVNELMELNHYITNRMDELLDIPILKHAKKTRIVTILNMYQKQKKVTESKVVRAAKKAKLGKVLKYGSMALNAVNPVYWFRKLVINTSIDVMTRKVCVVIIGVVGEETTKVYSKKLFDKDVDLGLVDENMEDLLTEGDDEDDGDQDT